MTPDFSQQFQGTPHLGNKARTFCASVGAIMDIVTVVRLEDVNGQPVVKLGGVPAPLKVGDHMGLKFRIARNSNGRHEVLDVNGQFQIKAVGFDASVVPRRQLLSVESLVKPPTWRSIRKTPQRAALAPAKSPRTSIE